MKAFSFRSFFILTVLLVVLKSVIGFVQFSYNNDDTINYAASHFKSDFSKQYSGDEGEVIRSALYYRKTGQIMTDSPFHSFAKPRLRPAGIYLTAFRPKAFIYIHVWGIGLYEKWTHDEVRVDHFDRYLHYYALIFCILKTLLFILSVFFFYRSLQLLLLHKSLVYAGTLLYILIPSIFIYIGWLDCWENPSLSLLMIYFYYFLRSFQQAGGLGFIPAFVIAALALLSVWVRPHLLLIYLALSFLLVCFYISNARKNHSSIRFSALRLPLFTILLIIAGHIPILLQNKQYFGTAFLSTQSQFEFFQGHNPFARSSWNPNLYTQNKAYFDSVINSRQLGDNVSEYEEGKLYLDLAKDWSIHHPAKEVALTVKKVAGYFLPYNFLNHKFNVYTLVLGLSFFAFSFKLLKDIWKAKGKRNQIQTGMLVYAPALMTIVLTVLFFVGERWRYYAEPFFLVMLLLLIDNYITQRKDRTVSGS
jgi:hypothetical protein